MAKRGIILCMSCNQERYLNEEDSIRDTWGRGVINNEHPNLSLYFYRGGDGYLYDDENKVVNLPVGDGLYDTFSKTKEMFKWVNENCGDYDYIIRTNTSTYVNIDAILGFLESEDIDNDTLYGKCLLINKLNNCIPFLRGHFLIIPKSIVDVIIKYDASGEDDIVIGCILCNYFKQDYLPKHIKEIDGVAKIDENITDEILKSSFFIRVKDENNSFNNIKMMYKIDELYKNMEVKSNVLKPHNFTHIETPYGCIPI